jgi:hypothetical protein
VIEQSNVAMTINELTEVLSRLLVALMCLWTAGVALWMARHDRQGTWRPHLVFIAFWSLMFGGGMTSLAIGCCNEFLAEAINVSAAMTLGAWTLLVVRLQRAIIIHST